ncbi:MAG: SLC13/DASS family transporter [Desulfobacteraceae bacterium]|nr:MAG: SLC13/DASS family transporter [Desulfobacteraceae bacterium]
MDITAPILIVTCILLIVLVLLITEKISVDRISVGAMTALIISGILTPNEAVAGFANPAVITVGAMFLISRGLIRTGAVEFISERVLHLSKGKGPLAFIIILLTVGLSSAFINNTPVVVLFVPIVMSLSCEYDTSPSKLLIPVSYTSILAGTCTLIGTSTNIIVSDLSSLYGYGKLGMFELTVVGLPIAIAGVLFLLLFSSRLMPGNTAPVCEIDDREDKRYLAQLLVPSESPLIGQDPIPFFADKFPSLLLIETVRDSRLIDPDDDTTAAIREGDILLVKGSADDLVGILEKKIVTLPHGEEGIHFGPGLENDLIVELIIPPQSSVLRERLLSTSLQGDPDIQIIAIKSRRLHYSEQKIQNVKLRIGDIILVRCPKKKLEQIRTGYDYIIIEDVHHAIIDKSKARWAFIIFAGVVVSASTGLSDIMTSALAGVFLMAMAGCFRLRDAYRSLEPEILLLIVGMIALGSAMEKTGASQLYAESFLSLFKGLGPQVVLSGIILLCSISSQILSNNATAVLLLPIAISTALTLGVDPKPFIVGICFGASACFATPIGYQTNLLVYGPGGYRFSDYLKMGIPMNLIVIVMGSILIPLFWPL